MSRQNAHQLPDKMLSMTLLASTPEAVDASTILGPNYLRVIEEWGPRLRSVPEITNNIRQNWRADLREALESDLRDQLLERTSADWRARGLPLPAEDQIRRFATASVRGTLGPDSDDLLIRLHRSARGVKGTAALSSYMTEGRTNQTAAQIFDMANDRLEFQLARHAERRGLLTGRVRWQNANPSNSRHKDLHGEVRQLGQDFSSGTKSPRPPFGKPGEWSNCSCYLQHETVDGEWV